MSVEVETKPETTTGPRRGLPRHIVELDDKGAPFDECLCGFVWDVYPIPHDTESGICQECVDELRRRGLG